MVLENFSLRGTSITSLYIHENINSIGAMTFSGLNNVDVTVSEDNENFKCEQGTYILSKNGEKLIAVSKNLETYTIPSCVINTN